jgi:hypothetical protein
MDETQEFDLLSHPKLFNARFQRLTGAISTSNQQHWMEIVLCENCQSADQVFQPFIRLKTGSNT